MTPFLPSFCLDLFKNRPKRPTLSTPFPPFLCPTTFRLLEIAIYLKVSIPIYFNQSPVPQKSSTQAGLVKKAMFSACFLCLIIDLPWVQINQIELVTRPGCQRRTLTKRTPGCTSSSSWCSMPSPSSSSWSNTSGLAHWLNFFLFAFLIKKKNNCFDRGEGNQWISFGINDTVRCAALSAIVRWLKRGLRN